MNEVRKKRANGNWNSPDEAFLSSSWIKLPDKNVRAAMKSSPHAALDFSIKSFKFRLRIVTDFFTVEEQSANPSEMGSKVSLAE